ncbi:MAG TPA: carbonic anhydrase [Planctomycetaceae bacterium]|nr:carbonic anhydrase [Planctomycetaceae bacterium]
MEKSEHHTRRYFCQRLAIATGVVGHWGVASVSALRAADRPAQSTPDAVLEKLLKGNQRFVEGRLIHPRRGPKDFAAAASGQAPLAVIMACADSRVAPELVFDQGIGDLFVVRIAGNIVSGAGPTVKGSIEYAVAELGARLIMVLGHTGCGACKAAIEHIESNDALPGAIGELINPIRPIVRMVAGQPGNKLTNVINANVKEGVKRLKGLEPILSKLVNSGELKVVGGTYQLSTGSVELLG